MLDVSRGFILNDIIRNLGRKVLPTRLMSALRNLKRNKDIVITKADKGNKVVILNRDEYEEKLSGVLSDESVYCKLNKNPLKIWQAEYNRNLKSIFANMPSLFNRFKSYLPSLPYMYALPKIHKADVPLRPIIASVNSVTYSLSKYLSSLLKPLLGKISGSHIINSTDFVEKIRGIDLTDKVMVSFDVDSLFTNVPIDETLNFLEDFLPRSWVQLPFSVEILSNLVRLCVTNCNFTCNEKFYRQISGLPWVAVYLLF